MVPRLLRARILGTGVRTPVGNSIDEVWTALCTGTRSATTRRFEFSDEARRFVVAITAEDEDRFSHAERRRMDRLHRLGVAAALDAVEAAGIDLSGPRVGIVAGVGLPAPATLETQHALTLTAPRQVSPLAIPLTMLNGIAADIARRIDATGPTQTVSTACTAGADAIGIGMVLLSAGIIDRAVIVGADAPLTASVLWAFARSSALSGRVDAPEAASQPFGADREGFVLAEGAAALVLDTANDPGSHGAFVGYGASNDAYHLTAPHPAGRGARQATAAALAAAGIRASDVVSVNSHGTSTRLNDAIEARVIADTYGSSVPVTATKAATGHMIGGSGILEALVAARSAVEGMTPPAGAYALDPELAIRLVTDEPVGTGPGPVVSHSFGFGGQNAVIVAAP